MRCSIGIVAERPAISTLPVRSERTAGRLVAVVLGLVALIVAGLLVASLLPEEMLTSRLLPAAGQAPPGMYTLALIEHLDDRLRLAAVLLLGLTVGLAVLRGRFADLLSTPLSGLTRNARWPAGVEWLAVGGPTLLAIALRVPFLNQPMRYDEALTFNEFASRPLYYGLSFYPEPNNHLLNTLLVHFADVALGNQPWVLRLPAFFAGVLLVPATYALARLLYGSQAALLSALLIAVSSYLVEFSTNSRGYTLQALCFVGMLSLAIVAARRDNPSALLLATLVGAAGTYALPTMLYGVVVAVAWFALEARRVRLVRIGPGQVATCGLLFGLVVTFAYLPVILVSGPENLLQNRFVVSLNLPELASELPQSMARAWSLWNRDVPLAISALLVVGFAIESAAAARRGRLSLGLLALGVCVGIALVQRVAPFERVWLFLLPLYFCVASGGLVELWAHSRVPRLVLPVVGVAGAAVLGLATLTSGSILGSPETGAFPDAEAVARTLSGHLAPDDAVHTTVPASLPELQYYFPRVGLSIKALVREPYRSGHLYLVVPPDTIPSVPGWGQVQEVKRFSGSELLMLDRG